MEAMRALLVLHERQERSAVISKLLQTAAYNVANPISNLTAYSKVWIMAA